VSKKKNLKNKIDEKVIVKKFVWLKINIGEKIKVEYTINYISISFWKKKWKEYF